MTKYMRKLNLFCQKRFFSRKISVNYGEIKMVLEEKRRRRGSGNVSDGNLTAPVIFAGKSERHISVFFFYCVLLYAQFDMKENQPVLIINYRQKNTKIVYTQ